MKILDAINRYLERAVKDSKKHEFIERLKHGKDRNMTDDPGPH
jgi:hypothetical protein